MVALLQSWFGFSAKVEKPLDVTFTKSDSDYRVGEYRAEYSLPSEAEIAADDADLADLYNRSKPVSR
jgi:hypothetical protein